MQLNSALIPDRDNIATFVEVVRRGSLAAAARHLSVPKSTVSRRLVRLEEQLALQLLHRDARRITLTDTGRSFFETVAGPVDALDQAVRDLEYASTQPTGTVRITAPNDLGRMMLIEPLVEFMAECPLVSVELIFTNRMVDLVQEGVDIAIRAGRVEDSNLIARRLFESEFHLVAAASEDAPDCDLEDLIGHPFVLFGQHSGNQTIRLEHRATQQSIELQVEGRLRVTDYETMMDLVAAGQGLGLMPWLHSTIGQRRGQLQRIFPDYALPGDDVHLVTTTRRLPERVRRAVDFFYTTLKDEKRIENP